MDASPELSRRILLVAGVLAAIGVALGVLWLARGVRTDPNIALLLPEGGAVWIKYPEATSLRMGRSGENAVRFRVRFTVEDAPERAVLAVRAMKRARVLLNGREILPANTEFNEWKQTRRVDLARALPPGPNTLEIAVENSNGPCLVLAYCPELGIATGPTWEAAKSDAAWEPAIGADVYLPSDLAGRFQSAPRALRSVLPTLAVVYLVALVWVWPRKESPGKRRIEITPGMVRWVLLGAWLVLAVNNIFKIPSWVGLDIEGHMQYIYDVATKRRLPLADEGWQMFQAPLYYLVSAVFYLFFAKFTADLNVIIQALRVVPLLCGMAQVELCYRALRSAFPDAKHLQIFGMALGGFLPVNVYMSHYIGNEPMAAALSGLVFVPALGLLRAPEKSVKRGLMAMWGLALGLAVLTKVTILLMVPALLLVIGFAVARLPNKRLKHFVTAAGFVLGVATLISGWFFVRNQIELGTPVVGASSNIEWWQDPGYRTPNQFYTFGEALVRPVTAGTQGYWDSLYSTFWLDGGLSSMVELGSIPPWDYSYVIACALLAVVLVLAMLFGAIRAVVQPVRSMERGVTFATVCVATYVAVAMVLYLLVPAYSVGKAGYLLGLTPAFALLAAAGFEPVARRPIPRALIYAYIVTWTFAVYAGYFVR